LLTLQLVQTGKAPPVLCQNPEMQESGSRKLLALNWQVAQEVVFEVQREHMPVESTKYVVLTQAWQVVMLVQMAQVVGQA
jgi:hypothetical protein